MLKVFTFEQHATFMSSFSFRGSVISVHTDSKKLRLLVIRSFLVLIENFFCMHLLTPPLFPIQLRMISDAE